MDESRAGGPFPDPEIPDLDSAGRLVPPWIKYPNIRKGSMGWRMGMGEWYLEKFERWWHGQPREERNAYRLAYPEPDEWSGYFKSRNSN